LSYAFCTSGTSATPEKNTRITKKLLEDTRITKELLKNTRITKNFPFQNGGGNLRFAGGMLTGTRMADVHPHHIIIYAHAMGINDDVIGMNICHPDV